MSQRRTGKKRTKASIAPTKIRKQPRSSCASIAPVAPIATSPAPRLLPANELPGSGTVAIRSPLGMPRSWPAGPRASRTPSFALVAVAVILGAGIVACRFAGIDLALG